MKPAFLFLIASIITLSGCKKDNNTHTKMTGYNEWSYGNYSYSVQTTTRDWNPNMYLTALDTTASGLIGLEFLSTPTATGIYNIVWRPTAANEVRVYVENLGGADYSSPGNIPSTAYVTVQNGKIAVSMSSVWVKREIALGIDSVMLTANISE